MIKNLIIVNDSNYICGGEDKVAIQTANEISQNTDINVIFFSCNYKEDENCLDPKIKQISTKQGNALDNIIKGSLNGLINLKGRKKLKETLLQYNPHETIVHVHSWSKAVTSEVFDICSKNNYHCILTMHDYFIGCPNGGFFNYKKNKICKYKPLSIKCICCNCDSRNYLFKIYRLIRQLRIKSNVKKIKNVISISNFSEQHLIPFLSNDCDIKRIYNPIDFENNIKKEAPEKSDIYLYVGRVSAEKGVDVFCEAITLSNSKGVVVGDGPSKAELQLKYPNIEFCGWKSANDVKSIMKKARSLIIPSKWYEVAPLTPLEAMQFGIPCISSYNNATVDYLKDNVGVIFTNIDELVNIINEFKDDKIVKKYSENCYKYINTVWKKMNYKEELVNYYNEVLQKEGVNYEN